MGENMVHTDPIEVMSVEFHWCKNYEWIEQGRGFDKIS